MVDFNRRPPIYKTDGKTLKTDGYALLVIFIGVMIATALIGDFGDTANRVTNTITVANETHTTPANGTSAALTGRTLVGSAEVWNASAYKVASSNVTVTSGELNGVQTVYWTVTNSSLASVPLNISYTFEPDGYVSDSGGRAITNLIPLFAALAILFFVFMVLYKKGTLGKLMGRNS